MLLSKNRGNIPSDKGGDAISFYKARGAFPYADAGPATFQVRYYHEVQGSTSGSIVQLLRNPFAATIAVPSAYDTVLRGDHVAGNMSREGIREWGGKMSRSLLSMSGDSQRSTTDIGENGTYLTF